MVLRQTPISILEIYIYQISYQIGSSSRLWEFIGILYIIIYASKMRNFQFHELRNGEYLGPLVYIVSMNVLFTGLN